MAQKINKRRKDEKFKKLSLTDDSNNKNGREMIVGHDSQWLQRNDGRISHGVEKKKKIGKSVDVERTVADRKF